MGNEFLSALGTDSANKNTDLSLYAKFIGDWSFVMTTYDENGQIEKTLTKIDIDLIKEGYDKAVKILLRLGVDPQSIVATSLKGAHPGGTAAVGEVVGNNFESEIKGLYVCDASVIPEAPGRPPILTIVAIAKKVAKILNQSLEDDKNGL